MFENEFFGYSLKHISELYELNVSMATFKRLISHIPHLSSGDNKLSLMAKDNIFKLVGSRTKIILIQLICSAEELLNKNITLLQSKTLKRIVKKSMNCLRLAFVMDYFDGKKISYDIAQKHFSKMGGDNSYLKVYDVSSKKMVSSKGINIKLIPLNKPIFPYIFRGWWARWALFQSSNPIIFTEICDRITEGLEKSVSFIQMLPYLVNFKRSYKEEIQRIGYLKSKLWPWLHNKSISTVSKWEMTVNEIHNSSCKSIHEKLMHEDYTDSELEALLKHLLKIYCDNGLSVDEIIGELMHRYWSYGGKSLEVNRMLCKVMFASGEYELNTTIPDVNKIKSSLADRMPEELMKKINGISPEKMTVFIQEGVGDIDEFIQSENWDKFYLSYLMFENDSRIETTLLRILKSNPLHPFWLNIKYSDLGIFHGDLAKNKLNDLFIDWVNRHDFNSSHYSIIKLYFNDFDWVDLLMSKYSEKEILVILPKLIKAGINFKSAEYVCESVITRWLKSSNWLGNNSVEMVLKSMSLYKDRFMGSDIEKALAVHAELNAVQAINYDWGELYTLITMITTDELKDICLHNTTSLFVRLAVDSILEADVAIVTIQKEKLSKMARIIYDHKNDILLNKLRVFLDKPSLITLLLYGTNQAEITKEIMDDALDVGLIKKDRYQVLMESKRKSLRPEFTASSVLQSAIEMLSLAKNDLKFAFRYVTPLKASMVMMRCHGIEKHDESKKTFNEIQSFISQNGGAKCQ